MKASAVPLRRTNLQQNLPSKASTTLATLPPPFNTRTCMHVNVCAVLLLADSANANARAAREHQQQEQQEQQ